MGFSYISKMLVTIVICGGFFSTTFGEYFDRMPPKAPTVGISVLVRNKAHTLPYFLSTLLKQTYPKKRLYFRFYCDHTSDNSLDIIKHWVKEFGSLYHATYVVANETSPAQYKDEHTTAMWSLERFQQVIKLRQDALEFARRQWADYLFMLDADVFLTEPDTLRLLTEQRRAVVAPMLQSEGAYSNFWCAVQDDYFYKRCEQYFSFLDRELEYVGCHSVPMVHSAVLISLRNKASDQLTYLPYGEDYYGPVDDTVVFAYTATSIGMLLHVCNYRVFGYVPKPAPSTSTVSSDILDRDNLLNVKLQAIARGTPLPLIPELQKFVTYPPKDTLNCSKIFLINLERRVERRQLMELSFQELGLDVEVKKAVDAMQLTQKQLQNLNVKVMPDYEDPYHKRPMKAGEIGCFLSHYSLWKMIIKHRFELTMILEDDVRFVPFFKQRLSILLEEVSGHDYDLLYLGRKILMDSGERPVTAHTIKPLYSYWTIGYIITLKGAQKLVDGKPLQNILPVDEYLPIMFNQHPNEAWKAHFRQRNLKALSASPLLVYPTHYTGMPGYLSDTEDSPDASEIPDDLRTDL